MAATSPLSSDPAARRTLGTVVVSGGASGLGAAVADAVAAAGGDPVVFDLQPARGELRSERVDVARRDDVERAIEAVARERGGIDGLVACAGIDACGPLDRVTPEAWERVIAVNLLGTASLARAALPHLERAGGTLVTVASTLGLRGFSDATAYCASKFGVVGFTRALAAELRGRVGVTLLIPGGMQTAFFDGRDPQYQPPADARLADPRSVADAVVYALTRPRGCEIRELLIAPSGESSWP